MFSDPINLFATITAVGLIIMILGFRLAPKTRKSVETAGAILFHIGVLGILYHKVALFLFISLAALVLSLFVLFDPLKISQYVKERYYRLVGYFFLALAVIFSLAYLTDFPPQLWLIPLLIYLLPYLVPARKPRIKLILSFAWIVVLGYLGFIGFLIYHQQDLSKTNFLKDWLNPKTISEPVEPDDIEDDFKLPPNPTVKTIAPQQAIIPAQMPQSFSKDEFDGKPADSPKQPVAPSPQSVSVPLPTEPVITQETTPLDDNAKLKQAYETLKDLYEQLAAENKELKDKLKTE